jgi:type IV/VI secretion system ImpK/VasF family protein
MSYDQLTSIQNDTIITTTDSSLLNTVMPILSLLILLKKSQPEGSVQNINAFLIRCMNLFEQNANRLEFSNRQILATKYCLCTAIDEAILSTSWGKESDWNTSSLLGSFFKEAFGGERFYIIMDTMLEDPATNAPLLEIIYILLALGFQGKNYNKDPLVKKAIQQDLFKKIEPFISQKHECFLSSYTDALPKKSEEYSLWFITMCVFVFVLITNLAFDIYTQYITSSFFKTADTIINIMDKNIGMNNEKNS